MQLRLTTSPGPLRCSGCGYNLSGVGVGQVMSECPECGTPFDPGDGARPRRWPATWVLGVYLCGGMMLLGAMYGLAWVVGRWSAGGGGATFAKELVAILNQCVLPVWFVSPIVISALLVRRYAYRGERWTVGLGLGIAGIVGNTVMAMGAMLVAVLVR